MKDFLKTLSFKKIFRKSAVSFLIFSVLVSSVTIPTPVRAQSGGASGGDDWMAALDLGGLAGILASCAVMEIKRKKEQYQQDGTGGVVGQAASWLAEQLGLNEEEEEEEPEVEEDTGGTSQYVPVNDKDSIKAIKGFDKDTNKKLKEIKREEFNMRSKERCGDVLLRYLVVTILDKITLATVEWINTGFEKGGPLYLSDPEAFLNDLAQDEIQLVAGSLSGFGSADVYPFGHDVMTSILTNLQSDFYQEAQISLNQVLSHGTVVEFEADFNVGGLGWNLSSKNFLKIAPVM